VKSLKTSLGSVVRTPGGINAVVSEMREFRGEIEGGIVVRRVEDLVAETERRYFVLGGVAHAADGGALPELVRTIAARIASPFFSVDMVVRGDGKLRLVEVGDGQVSDLVGWAADAFVDIWRARR
jgi:hypothetical protein